MKMFRALSRLIIGLTFIFSGFTKIIDPVGGGLIVGEYFKILGIGSFPSFYQALGTALSAAELLLGISVLLGLKMKISCKIALGFVSVFTLITLFLAIFNPIHECGCFGEALKLTNWQTFYKNVFLLFFALMLYFQRDKFIPIAPENWEWGFVGVYAILVAILSVYSYKHLPLIDFMDYKVGTDIREKLSMTESSGGSSLKTKLIYKKDGRVKEFMINELPDSTWTFVASKTKLTSSESLQGILNFAVSDRDGNYVTDSLLSIDGKFFIISIPYFERLTDSDLKKIKQINEKLTEKNISHIILSGSSYLMADSIGRDSLNLKIFYTDSKTLLTMNRSNGGLIYLNDATVSAKWSVNDLPVDSIDSVIREDPELLAAKSRIREQLAAEIAAAIILLLVVLMRYVCRFVYTHKIIRNENNPEPESQKS
ncbi:MAG: BT_3928 family protein [Rikenellaceae bacterium]